jgi:histone deacetylase 6
MQFLRASTKKRKDLVMAYGSQASKKRRTTYSSGPASAGSPWEACHIVEAPIVQESDLRLVHSKRHIEGVVSLSSMAAKDNVAFFPLIEDYVNSKPPTSPRNRLNDDVYYSPDSLTAMKRAAGGAVEAVRRLFVIDSCDGRAVGRSDIESSFAIVRPPGHHCCTEPNGFCYFNNTAIAAAHARKVLGLSRVAIVDWDYHHGDGQQKSFYRDPTILTISLHVAMERSKRGVDSIAFPCNMGMDLGCNGIGEGQGYNINIPWPHDKVGAPEYDEAFNGIVLPALQGFAPELILVASGFDAVAGDTLAGTCLPPRSYYDMTRKLLSLETPVAVILEGGYSPERLAQGSLNVTHALLGRAPPPCNDDKGIAVKSEWEPIDVEAMGVLDAVRRRLNRLPPWNQICRPGSDEYFYVDSSPASIARSRFAINLTEKIQQQALVS